MTTWINLEDIILSETGQPEKDKYCIIYLYVKFRNIEFIEPESRTVVTRSYSKWRKWGYADERVQTSSYQMNNLWESNYSIANTVNNIYLILTICYESRS